MVKVKLMSKKPADLKGFKLVNKNLITPTICLKTWEDGDGEALGYWFSVHTPNEVRVFTSKYAASLIISKLFNEYLTNLMKSIPTRSFEEASTFGSSVF